MAKPFEKIKNVIIIGSSRGLGAALVDEFLKINSFCNVIGISRTNQEDISYSKNWLETSRYTHIELDITSENSFEILSQIFAKLKNEPVCVVYNAACIKTDVDENKNINWDIFNETNNVGIYGLQSVVKAFEYNLVNNYSIFVGISSFSAFTPPLILPKISYPASKAYMNMLLKCLRFNWNKRAKVITVNLGHIGHADLPKILCFFAPTYSNVAKNIVEHLSNRRIPDEINYTWIYNIIYRYILPLIPENIYFNLFKYKLGKVK